MADFFLTWIDKKDLGEYKYTLLDYLRRENGNNYLCNRDDHNEIMVEVLPLTNYIRSADEHQDRLSRCHEDYSFCHIPKKVMYRHK